MCTSIRIHTHPYAYSTTTYSQDDPGLSTSTNPSPYTPYVHHIHTIYARYTHPREFESGGAVDEIRKIGEADVCTSVKRDLLQKQKRPNITGLPWDKEDWGSSCMHNISSVKRDLQVSKETYKCQKRPTIAAKEAYNYWPTFGLTPPSPRA